MSDEDMHKYGEDGPEYTNSQVLVILGVLFGILIGIIFL